MSSDAQRAWVLATAPNAAQNREGGEKVCVCVFTVISARTVLKGANRPVIFFKKALHPASPAPHSRFLWITLSLPQGLRV